ncbi:MAG TPA: RidA family protein [Solirubrobacterales bacterium]|nr:RidA family protein [Solirubrobacterales bacterium]
MSELPLSQSRTAGGLVFVSGQVGLESDGTVPGSFERQAELALGALLAALREADAGAVMKTTLYLVRREDFAAMNEVYSRYFSAPWPARTTLVAELALPGLLFEVDAVARTASGT